MADKPPAKSGKILGMPRTTGIVVLVIGAAVVGYFLVSKLGGSKGSTGSGSGGSGGGRPSYAAGGTTIVRIIRGHHGHKPKPPPHHKGK